jgi:SET domain-containing protein
LGILHAEELKNHTIADVSIQWVDGTIGYGLFAEKDLSAGDFIGEYAGVVRKINMIYGTINMIYGTINEYCFAYPTAALSFRKHIIDARHKGNEIRYANHSDTPNCESMGVVFGEILHIILRAIQDIPANEEITYDYSGYYWLTKRKWFHF